MSIKIRLLVILAALGALSAGSFLVFQYLQGREADALLQSLERAQSLEIRRNLSEASASIWRYVRNYSARPAMAEFVANPDQRWAEKNLQDRLDIYRVDAVWVISPGGTPLYSFNRQLATNNVPAPLPAMEFDALFRESSSIEFFLRIDGVLYQIFGAPIRAATPNTQHHSPAWLIAGRIWDRTALDDLANSSHGRIVLTGPSHTPDSKDGSEREIWLPLRNHRGDVVAGFDYHVQTGGPEPESDERIETAMFVINASLIVLAAGLLLHWWIWKPFATIQQSLVTENPAPLLALMHRSDEFGRLSRTVLESLRDREQLARALEHQATIGRELHDNVIQSIFGVGMTIARVEDTLAKAPQEETVRQLRDSRAELNRIIANVRSYIEGADPRPPEGSFGESVRQIAMHMQGRGPQVEISLSIDESLVNRYAPLCRGQLLQFTREALSNAFRHGRPSLISVSWQAQDDGSVLQITDDGRGFAADDPTSRSRGRGLGNLSERALSLGGQLELSSRPGEGTRLRLVLRSPDHTP